MFSVTLTFNFTSSMSSLCILCRSQQVRALTSALDFPGRTYRLMGSPKMSFLPGGAEHGVIIYSFYQSYCVTWTTRWSYTQKHLPSIATTMSPLRISMDPLEMKYSSDSRSPAWTRVSPGGAWVVLNLMARALRQPLVDPEHNNKYLFHFSCVKSVSH